MSNLTSRVNNMHHHGLSPPLAQGRSIAVVRTLFGISSESLASAASLTPYSLSRLERCHRKPSPGEIPRLVSLIGQLLESDAA